jgi:hypothetical protein
VTVPLRDCRIIIVSISGYGNQDQQMGGGFVPSPFGASPSSGMKKVRNLSAFRDPSLIQSA